MWSLIFTLPNYFRQFYILKFLYFTIYSQCIIQNHFMRLLNHYKTCLYFPKTVSSCFFKESLKYWSLFLKFFLKILQRFSKSILIFNDSLNKHYGIALKILEHVFIVFNNKNKVTLNSQLSNNSLLILYIIKE